ncbi:outer membrane protein assembly factor BamA [Candidatus Pelagibacter sp. Uisw_127]|uniref:outer membrane protein assembly factor BamA n=1 Tax=Candidatus Pelagibacter sp. Uisw_127 TaxID=3230988 RepID=UPI0039ED7144
MIRFLLIILCSFSLHISAVYSKNYNKIKIDGNLRISDETIIVFSELPDKKFLDENSLNLILKRLFNTGFFKDISIKIETDVLKIDVIENPIIQSVLFEGLKSKTLIGELSDTLTLKDRSSFNIAKVRNDEIRMVNLLKDKGYYFPKIITTVTDLKKNKVNLTYFIDIGKKSKISKISFIGDKKIKDNKLRSIIISEEYKFWKFISGKKFLNEDLINFDKKLLNNFYKNNGFYNVNIESTFANYLGSDEFELIYNISSGEKFIFNDLSLNLPIDYDINDFSKLNKIFDKMRGEVYSLNSIDKILNEIDKITLENRYEFLTSDVNEEIIDNLINLTFNIKESEKFYVEKINIFGNNITREDVIRNNLEVDEGDPFNNLLHAKSINNLKALNFFRTVSAEVLDGSITNQKIINIQVDEKPTGEISAGAGIGSDGGSVGFSVKENNFLGRGITFASDLTLSAGSVKGLMSLNNPNYHGSNKSLNFSLESSVSDRLKDFGYKSNKAGFSVGSGFEYYNNLFLNLGISSYIEKLETDATASASMLKQKGNYFDTFFNYNFDYDTRNQKFQTSDGFRSKFSQYVPLISDNYSLTSSYDYKIYNQWLNENVATFSFYVSTTNSLSNKNVKLSERLFLPSSKLRGFERGKVGPKDGTDHIGGNNSMAMNVATTLPKIFSNFEEVDFSIFMDAANVWGIDYSSSLSDSSKIRSSVGLAINLFTPVGPLSFVIAEPLTKNNGDITESFRFNLGTTF